MLWKKLKQSNSDLAELFNLPKRDGRLAITKGERIAIICFAPILIVFFSYVRSGLIEMIGNGIADKVVRIFLEELYITFLAFVFLALILCFFRPLWLERLLMVSVRKLVLVLQFIYVLPFILLACFALYSYLTH